MCIIVLFCFVLFCFVLLGSAHCYWNNRYDPSLKFQKMQNNKSVIKIKEEKAAAPVLKKSCESKFGGILANNMTVMIDLCNSDSEDSADWHKNDNNNEENLNSANAVNNNADNNEDTNADNNILNESSCAPNDTQVAR